MNVRSRISRFFAFIHRNEEAQGLAEYALILALIAMIAIVALVFMGTQLSDKLSVIGDTIESVAP